MSQPRTHAVPACRHGRHLIPTLLALALAALALPLAALALPTAALAGTEPSAGGGAGLPGAGGASGGAGITGTSAPTVATGSADAPVMSSGDGVTLETTASALLRRGLTFSGSAPGAAGSTIEIERSGAGTAGQWTPTAQATVAANGSFTATWETDAAGQFAVRAAVLTQLAATATLTPSLTVTVYRTAKATFYGPGFYGRRTACGATLTRSMLGVANRTLRCGTPVSIDYDGRTLVVPVIDRGPYANGADWDLTMATAQALGMDSTARIGAASLPNGTSTTAGTAPALPLPSVQPARRAR